MINKEIEEIAKTITISRCPENLCDTCEYEPIARCFEYKQAERLYEQGYKKSSDVVKEILTDLYETVNLNDYSSLVNFIKQEAKKYGLNLEE